MKIYDIPTYEQLCSLGNLWSHFINYYQSIVYISLITLKRFIWLEVAKYVLNHLNQHYQAFWLEHWKISSYRLKKIEITQFFRNSKISYISQSSNSHRNNTGELVNSEFAHYIEIWNMKISFITERLKFSLGKYMSKMLLINSLILNVNFPQTARILFHFRICIYPNVFYKLKIIYEKENS